MKIKLVFAFLLLSFYSCKERHEPNQPDTSEDRIVLGCLQGKFSVSATWQVQFSQGNLQYRASTGTWRFAENQYDIIGNANSNISVSYSGWIDLFGWGTGDNPTKTSTDYNDYNIFVDWGMHVSSNDGNETYSWRTLTKDEWVYLLTIRPNANSLFGMGCVNGINGAIILPDDWVTPNSITFTTSIESGMNDMGGFYQDDSLTNHYFDNIYDADKWKLMEKNGAVFLPAAGYRLNADVICVGTYGFYWLTNSYDARYAYYLYFLSNYVGHLSYHRNCGHSVRLVR